MSIWAKTDGALILIEKNYFLCEWFVKKRTRFDFDFEIFEGQNDAQIIVQKHKHKLKTRERENKEKEGKDQLVNFLILNCGFYVGLTLNLKKELVLLIVAQSN